MLAAFGGICAERAVAGDEPDGIAPLPAFQANAAPERTTLMLLSGLDLWRNGAFLHGGVLWSPDGLDRDGVVLKAVFGSGRYRYYSGALGKDVTGDVYSASLLTGWRFTHGTFVATVFGGPDWQRHRLTPDDPGAGLRGAQFGGRAGFELWYEPSAQTMVAADASATTIGPSYSAQLRLGWKMLGRYYVGPEASAFAFDDNYRQFRLGLHITSYRTGWAEWSAGFGWATDSDDRSSPYGRIGVIGRY